MPYRVWVFPNPPTWWLKSETYNLPIATRRVAIECIREYATRCSLIRRWLRAVIAEGGIPEEYCYDPGTLTMDDNSFFREQMKLMVPEADQPVTLEERRDLFNNDVELAELFPAAEFLSESVDAGRYLLDVIAEAQIPFTVCVKVFNEDGFQEYFSLVKGDNAYGFKPAF